MLAEAEEGEVGHGLRHEDFYLLFCCGLIDQVMLGWLVRRLLHAIVLQMGQARPRMDRCNTIIYKARTSGSMSVVVMPSAFFALSSRRDTAPVVDAGKGGGG